jgi:hypothetical protein
MISLSIGASEALLYTWNTEGGELLINSALILITPLTPLKPHLTIIAVKVDKMTDN